MLTENLKNDLIRFILKKVGGNRPQSIRELDLTVSEIRRVVNQTLDNNLCLSVYYGVTFQYVHSLDRIKKPSKQQPECNWLVPKEFFKKLLKHHETTLLQSPKIRQELDAVFLNSFRELSPLGVDELFAKFNSFLVSNFQMTLSLSDFVQFIEQNLDLASEMIDLIVIPNSPETEKEDRTDVNQETSLNEAPLSWETLSKQFDEVLKSFATEMMQVMATDPLFEACDYDEKQLAFILNGPTSIKQRLIDALEKDRTYLRNEKGYFVKNERELIWNLMNSLCNLHTEDVPFDLTTQEMIGLNELYDLMTASEKGYEYYYHQFLKEFEQMRANQHVSDGFSTQVKHVLKSLNALHLECLFN